MNECETSVGMNEKGCEPFQPLLSAYLDGELEQAAKEPIESHLQSCEPCRKTLDDYRRMQALVTRVEPPKSTVPIWNKIEAQLSPSSTPPSRSWEVDRTPWWSLSIAIALAILLPIGMWEISRSNATHEQRLAAIFDEYLNRFETSPEEAQALIDSAYPLLVLPADSQEPCLTESLLRASDPVPGLTLVEFHVHELPCCDCVQAIYQRGDGTKVSVFEHLEPIAWDAHQRPRIVRCGDCECRLLETDHPLAASWEHHSHTFTAVGIADENELALLVSKL